MKIFKVFFTLLIFFLLTSCEKVIDVDLKTAEPKLVIDASINWQKNTTGNLQKIKLSTTTSYYSNTFPVFSGAEVTVTNSANNVFKFIENAGTGEYVCTNFQPVIGETYTLKILANGQTYTATETLMSVPNIENNIQQNNNGGPTGNDIEITYFYQDNPSQQNNYLYSFEHPEVAFPQYFLDNDENTQGKLTPVFYSHKDLKKNDVVNIKMYGISKRYYTYFKKIINASGSNSGPFGTVPSEVRGNIINQTNASKYAYGYFRLSEVDVKSYTTQ